jgi:predicted GNAT superfamily acetyltransferase
MKVEMKPAIEIRDINEIDEIRAVEELQKEVWGIPDIEVVPLTQMAAAIHSGGTLIGAFDGKEAIGFAYGFAGFERSRAVHHSHMLAVKPKYRSYDLGYRLKLAQRDRVLKQGIDLMTWTFDPLQSMNAHFNFAKLGVFADTYFADLYGSNAASFLHRIGTDRLWVTWPLRHERTIERIRGSASRIALTTVRKIVECGREQMPVVDLNGPDVLVAIDIPSDINELQKRDHSLAIEWRKETRDAFLQALSAGYIVEDFIRGDRDCSPGSYILSKGKVSIGW